jgi:hypothetical protein
MHSLVPSRSSASGRQKKSRKSAASGRKGGNRSAANPPAGPALTPLVGCPKLRVAIYRGDTIARYVEMDDPREQFCKTYNELTIGVGVMAIPAAS